MHQEPVESVPFEPDDEVVWTDEGVMTTWEASVVEGDGMVLLTVAVEDHLDVVCVTFHQWDQIVAAVAEARKAVR